MGISRGQAINEGVALLDQVAPHALGKLRLRFPALTPELELGILAGESNSGKSESIAFTREKAEFMIAALIEVQLRAESALRDVSDKVRSARSQRLTAQILVVIGSSSCLATLAISQERAGVIAAVLTLLVSIGNLLADQKEKLLNPQLGSIYDALQRLSEGAYKARMMSGEMSVALKYEENADSIADLIAKANSLCEELNKWLVQLIAAASKSKP